MSWRRIQQKDILIHPYLPYPEDCPNSVHVEGSIYWYARENILCFDVAFERFKLIPAPDKKTQDLGFQGGRANFLVELDGSLCYMEHSMYCGMVGIWRMQKDCADKKNAWIKDYTIDVGCINYLEFCIKSVCIQHKKI